MTTATFEMVDRQILNVIQSEFPLVERPYLEIGRGMGIGEDETIQRIRELKRKNVVRQISAIFDTRRLGYKTSLVAMKCPDDRLDEIAQRINEHPGVSHNYAREGRFNLWFTLAVAPGEEIEAAVGRMADENGVLATRLMPTVRFFKIGVNFDMVKEVGNAERYFVPDDGPTAGGDGPARAEDSDWNTAQPLSERDIAVIRELQEDLELSPRPFDSPADRLGMSAQELFEYAGELVRRRLMRRFSAVLHHRRAGFSANAMAVWKVPEERAQEVGEIMARSKWVTHCYQRSTFPDWEYTHFTMVHATSREQCDQVVREIEAATGIAEHTTLYSTREYKKTRVRYFVQD